MTDRYYPLAVSHVILIESSSVSTFFVFATSTLADAGKPGRLSTGFNKLFSISSSIPQRLRVLGPLDQNHLMSRYQRLIR